MTWAQVLPLPSLTCNCGQCKALFYSHSFMYSVGRIIHLYHTIIGRLDEKMSENIIRLDTEHCFLQDNLIIYMPATQLLCLSVNCMKLQQTQFRRRGTQVRESAPISCVSSRKCNNIKGPLWVNYLIDCL